MSQFQDINFEPLKHLVCDKNKNGLELEAVPNASEICDENEPNTSEDLPQISNLSTKSLTLFNGHHLPASLRRKVTNEVTGKALKEISSDYKDKDTFVVIGRGSRILYRFGGAATFAKSGAGWRNQAISILTHGIFNYGMVLTILLNSYFLVIFATFPPQNVIPKLSSSGDIETNTPAHQGRPIAYLFINCAFLIVYILEFALKKIARGFWNRSDSFSTMMISWSWMDIFVIFIGFLQASEPESQTLLALSSFRVFKLIPLLPGCLSGYDRLMKGTWPRVMRTSFFAISVAVMIGLLFGEMYSQSLRNKCVLDEHDSETYGIVPKNISEEPQLCSNSSWSEPCHGKYTCQIAQVNTTEGDKFFDTFLSTELTLLNLYVQDFAEYIYEKIWAVHGFFHIIFFLLVLFMCTFPIGILIYSIVAVEFEKGFNEILDENSGDLKPKTKTQSNTLAVPSAPKFRQRGKAWILHPNFDVFITFIIILDIFSMGLDYFDSTDTPLLTFLNFVKHLVFFVYVLECVLKGIFIGWREYLKRPWNRFDFVIAIAIVLNTMVSDLVAKYGFSLTITALKIIPRWSPLVFFFTVMRRTWSSFGWLFKLIAIIIFTFGFIGFAGFGQRYIENMQVFPNSIIPRWNMVHFWSSLRVIFRAFCGEWNEVLWDLILISSTSFPAILFMTSVGLFGNFLIKCLGIGIVLSTFQILNQESQGLELRTLDRIFSLNPVAAASKFFKNPQEDSKIQNLGQETATANDDANGVERDVPKTCPENSESSTLTKIFHHMIYRIFASVLIFILFLCSLRWFIPSESIFVIYFGVELIGKGIGIGAVNRKLLQPGLTFDLVMILSSILALIASSTTFGMYCRYVARFRLLMIVSRNNEMSLVLHEFWRQIKLLSPHFLVVLYIWYLFAIYGMQHYMGTFYKCIDDSGNVMDYRVVGNKGECMEQNLTWTNSPLNFDSLPKAFQTLAFVSLRNGWLEAIGDASDSRWYQAQPIRGNNVWTFYYFIAFLLFGVLFPFYTLIGILSNDFKKTNWPNSIFGNQNSSQTPPDGANTQQKLEGKTAAQTHSSLKSIVGSTYFELWVCLTIVADTIAHALENSSQESVELDRLRLFRHGILMLYSMELILRSLTSGRNFFKSGINILLLLTVLTSIVDVVMVEVSEVVYSMTFPRIFRLFHLFSIEKLWKWTFPEIKALGNAVLKTLRLVLIILILYSLLFIAYARFGSLAFDGVSDFKSWKSVTALFKIGTISGVDGIYARMVRCENNFQEGLNLEEPCLSPILVGIYEFTFIFITVLCFVNIYIVLILEMVEQIRQVGKDKSKQESKTIII